MKRAGEICSLNNSSTMDGKEGSVSIKMIGNITFDQVEAFRLDMKRGAKAIESKKKSPEEVGLWILSKYRKTWRACSEYCIKSAFIALSNHMERNEMIESGNPWLTKYNEEVKNYQELQKLLESI